MDHDHVLIAALPPPLARLILCGGEGLPAAWGPVLHVCGQRLVWDGAEQVAHAGASMSGSARELRLTPDSPWRLPLDHWCDRLALVAAWMLGMKTRAARVRWHGPEWWVSLDVWPDRGGVLDMFEWTRSGRLRRSAWSVGAPNLPTLNTLLPMFGGEHNPSVALLLSLWDVPEIRARVEAL